MLAAKGSAGFELGSESPTSWCTDDKPGPTTGSIQVCMDQTASPNNESILNK